MVEIDEGEYLELLAAKDALTGFCSDLIALEDKEWKPMQCFRSDAQVAHDDARYELACEIAEQARGTLAQVMYNAELTSPPPVGFDNKPDYGGGSG